VGVAGNLADHAGQIAALQSLLQREERIFGRGGGDMDHPAAQVRRQTRRTGPPAEAHRLCVLHPQHLTAIIACPDKGEGIARQSQRQSRPARLGGGSKDFRMERLHRQARTPARLGRSAAQHAGR
jgi:hypothetical protein